MSAGVAAHNSRSCWAWPKLTGTVVDLGVNVAAATELLAAQGLASRARVREGSFFEPLGIEADACLLAHVLHDWDDADALRILRRFRETVEPVPEGRVLVVERAVDEADNAARPPSKICGCFPTLAAGREISQRFVSSRSTRTCEFGR